MDEYHRAVMKIHRREMKKKLINMIVFCLISTAVILVVKLNVD